MKFAWISAVACIICMSATAQKGDDIVMTVDGAPITVSEFKNIYEKNNENPSYKKKDIKEYIDLFKDFKIVVAEAKQKKYDTIPRLKKELKGYRNQLARPYLIDKEKTEELVNEAYERMKKEVNASHLLIKVNKNASPEDTLKAYNKIKDIKKKIENGASFEAMARKHSADRSAKKNGGNLGYFSSLQMVYPFENAAYETEVGGVSKIIRTRFGYHILKVHDKRKTKGKMEAAHIMVAFSKKPDSTEIAKAEKKAQELYEKLEKGADFFDLAKKYSDDQSTKNKGGRLPFFGSGTKQRMLPKFEQKAFALEENGDISKPFKTKVGYHIIKRINLVPLKSFDKMNEQVRRKVNKDSRSKLTKKSFIQGLKKEYDFKARMKNVKALVPFVDSGYFDNEKGWSKEIKERVLKKDLMSFAGRKYQVSEFVNYLSHIQKRQIQVESVPEFLHKKFTAFADDEIYNYEKAHLDEKYSKFKNLMKEYKDGVLLFEIKQDMVWNKALKDTAGLKAFFEKNKSDYRWNKRYDTHVFDCKNKSTAEKVVEKLENKITPDTIVAKTNASSQLNVDHNHKKIPVKDSIAKQFDLEKGVNGPFEQNEKYFVYWVKEVLPAGPKKLEEARGIVTSDYQKYLEKEWMKKLRSEHKVKVNKDVLYNIEQ